MVQIISDNNTLVKILEFYEQEKLQGKYLDVDHREQSKTNDKTLNADLISILFSGGVGLVGALILDFFQKNSKHEITLETTNEKGEKMIITLKNLTTGEVKQAYEDFKQ